MTYIPLGWNSWDQSPVPRSYGLGVAQISDTPLERSVLAVAFDGIPLDSALALDCFAGYYHRELYCILWAMQKVGRAVTLETVIHAIFVCAGADRILCYIAEDVMWAPIRIDRGAARRLVALKRRRRAAWHIAWAAALLPEGSREEIRLALKAAWGALRG